MKKVAYIFSIINKIKLTPIVGVKMNSLMELLGGLEPPTC